MIFPRMHRLQWQLLAHQKLEEIEQLMQNLQVMKALLQQALQCQCATLEDCAAQA